MFRPLSTRQPIKDASGAPVAQMMNVGSFAEQVLVHYSQVAVMPADVGFDVAVYIYTIFESDMAAGN